MADQTITIPNGWKSSTLEEVVLKAYTGADAIKRAPITNKDTGIKCLRIQDVSQKKDYKNWGFASVSPSDFERFQLKKGELFIARTGASIGVNLIINKDLSAVFNNGLIRLRINKKSIPEYVSYLLFSKSFKNYILSISQGTSTQPNIQIGALLRFPIIIPPISEQNNIVSVLSSLDRKIDLLKDQNNKLEATAQAIFKEWFVNFNFPGATGKMIDSELGEIPEGWRVGKLGEFIDVRGGLSYDGKLISKTGTPMITMGFVSGEKRYEESGIKYYSGQYNQQHQIKAGSLVIATRDVTQDRRLIGSPSIIPNYFGDSKIIAATNLYIVQNISFLPNRFLYLIMRTPEYRERVIGACKGTTIVLITKDSVLDYEFVIPNKDLVEKFSLINESIFDRLELIDNQIQILSTLRDTLLPKLMKGEVRVKGLK